MKRYNKEQVEELIARQPEGRNTRFLNASHSLWFRFKNYEKQPPFVMEVDGEAVALVFITFSARSKYANLYEIVTLEGKEGNGYASKIYWDVMQAASDAGMTRLKMSCTSTSVTWHMRNGCIFWAVDPSGSLRVDQPLFPTKAEQLAFREEAIGNNVLALPSEPVIEKLKGEGLESHGFGAKKTARVEEAIEEVGNYWLRLALFEPTHFSLDDFLS